MIADPEKSTGPPAVRFMKSTLRRFPRLRSAYHLLGAAWDIARGSQGAVHRDLRLEYESQVDPWAYPSTQEEQNRYAIALDLVESIGDHRTALEVGCGEGLFTRLLSERCQSILAVDVIETALERARANCADVPSVRIERWDARRDPPPGRFDLVLCMDVMEYLSSSPIAQRRAMRSVCSAIAPGGALLITVCRTHPVVEHASWARFLGTGANGVLARFLATDSRLTVAHIRSTRRHLVALCKAS